MARRSLAVALAFCLLANGFCHPHLLRKRATENETKLDISSEVPTTAEQNTPEKTVSNELPPPIPYNDDDDDDDFDMNTSSSGDSGGSNIFSLLRIAGAILPGSSNAGIQDPADAPSPLWTLKLDILRAVVQFATSVLGMASSYSFSASSG